MKFKDKELVLSNIGDIIGSTGLIFILFGFVGIMYLAFSPFNLIGAIIYISIGLKITLTYSNKLRNYFISLLPLSIKDLLYEKSLIEIFSEPSPIFKIFMLIGLNDILSKNEHNLLLDKLPPICKTKGLFNILPHEFKVILNNNDQIVPLIENSDNYSNQVIQSQEITTNNIPDEKVINPVPKIFHNSKSSEVLEFNDELSNILLKKVQR